MHVLMLADRMELGGAETHIATLCRTLLSRGHTVTLLSAGGRVADRLSEDGVHTVLWRADRRAPLAVLGCILRLRQVLRDRSIDLIHAHTRFGATLASRLFARRCPTVSTVHLPFPRRGLGRLSRFGRHALAVSEDIAEQLREVYGIAPERLTVTVNGIDTARFCPPPVAGRDIVHASRFDPDRAACALALCRIAPRLLPRLPDRRIHLIGGGTWEGRVRTAAQTANRALGFEGVIVHPATDELPRLLRQGCLFVGVSRAALEAMSMGLPVILAGNDGYGGILDEEGIRHAARTNLCARDEAAIDDKRLLADILTTLSDSALRARLGAVGMHAVHEHFSAARMAEDAIAVYRRVLLPKSAFIIGYYGHGNLGDEAMLQSIRSSLMQRNIYNIHVLAKESSEDGTLVGRQHILALMRHIRGADLILFGGGNLLQNETSRRSLLFYSLLLRYAHARGRRILMIGTGLGPVHGVLARAQVRHLLTLPRALFLRTHEDECEARALLGGGQKLPYVALAGDLCFRLPEQPHPCRGRRVLFLLRSIDARGALSLEDTVRRLRTRGFTVAFLAMHRTHDLPLAYRLGRWLHAPVLLADSPLAFSEHVADAALIVTERLHGAILSLLSHVPCYLRCHTVKGQRLLADVTAAAHTVGTRPPVRGFSSLSTLGRHLRSPYPRRATRAHPWHGATDKQARHKGRPLARRCLLARTYAGENEKVGGWCASDFGSILRVLRAGVRWERFAFYEDEPSGA